MKPENFAPIYACLYPQLAEITRKHGYALAAHGSLGRDFDLICIPWISAPSEPHDVVNEITSTFNIKEVGGPPSIREHGRLVYSLSLSFGECFLDFSFMPKQQSPINTNFRKPGPFIMAYAPEGAALVPIEPSRKQLDAARVYLVRDGEIDPMLKHIYRAMVEAAEHEEGQA